MARTVRHHHGERLQPDRLTSNGLAITLTKVGSDIVGSTSAGEVFRISVASNGTVTLTQSAELDHLPEDATGQQQRQQHQPGQWRVFC
ncbi:hypothetical protein H2136_23840 [Aeromonas hydrophila]|uniref:DUF5801 domain-containing protein n=1 Tax=Aeromonas hydrophila TaxID=644 RepID=A0A926FPA0_AERHY|nr:hypothetical protein [Aeromonas hydrophila]